MIEVKCILFFCVRACRIACTWASYSLAGGPSLYLFCNPCVYVEMCHHVIILAPKFSWKYTHKYDNKYNAQFDAPLIFFLLLIFILSCSTSQRKMEKINMQEVLLTYIEKYIPMVIRNTWK
jgi:hypothetical protein